MRLLLTTLIVAALTGCSKEEASGIKDSSNPTVAAVNYPLAFFADVMTEGTDIEVLFPEIAGDPAFWKLTDEQIAAFQTADIIFRNGATYAQWTKTVSLPDSTQKDTSKAFSGDFISEESSVTHTHGNGESHSHAGTASTTWLDFQQAIWQAEEVRDALIALKPEKETAITDAFNNLADELDKLHADLKGIGKKLNGRPLLASHPVYQYLARRYDLNIKSLHWEPDTELTEENLAELRELTADHPATAMLWEGKPSPASVEKLDALGIKSIVFDPCGNRPASGDFLSVMKENAARLAGLAQ